VSLFLSILLSALAGTDPGELHLETDRPVLLKGQGFDLMVRSTNPDFSGEVVLGGLSEPRTVRLENGVWSGKVTPIAGVFAEVGGKTYSLDRRIIPGWLCILPPFLAILLAFFIRDNIVALFAGIWLGYILILGFGFSQLLVSILHAVESVVLVLGDHPQHAMVLLYVLMLGGMFGIIVRSGGIKGFADFLSGKIHTRRRGMVATWFLGILFSLDDYSGSLSVGMSMRSLTDRLRISREKLAYLVDSVCAPMATISIFSAWVVFETDIMVQAGVSQAEVYKTFLSMLPYSFYSLFSILFVFLISVTQRDFGLMRKAENRAVKKGQLWGLGSRILPDPDLENHQQIENMSSRWTNLVVPFLVAIGASLIAFYLDGTRNPERLETENSFWQIMGHGDSHRMLLWGLIGGTVCALVMAVVRGHLRFLQATEAWFRGTRSMFRAMLILLLAWSMGHVCMELSTGEWMISHLEGVLSLKWFPAIVFVVSAVLSLSAGSSWGAMAFMFAVVVPTVMGLPDAGIQFGAMAAVLSGAVFGEHISPISDTTIISSIGAASDHIDHVRTQAPYAGICAFVAMGAGFIPVGFGVSPWICLPVGAALLIGVIFLLGKKQEIPYDLH
jgi:Na+/H+ antiporter NhaC